MFGVSEPRQPPPPPPKKVATLLSSFVAIYMPTGSRVSMHLLESLNYWDGDSNRDVKKATV